MKSYPNLSGNGRLEFISNITNLKVSDIKTINVINKKIEGMIETKRNFVLLSNGAVKVGSPYFKEKLILYPSTKMVVTGNLENNKLLQYLEEFFQYWIGENKRVTTNNISNYQLDGFYDSYKNSLLYMFNTELLRVASTDKYKDRFELVIDLLMKNLCTQVQDNKMYYYWILSVLYAKTLDEAYFYYNGIVNRLNYSILNEDKQTIPSLKEGNIAFRNIISSEMDNMIINSILNLSIAENVCDLRSMRKI